MINLTEIEGGYEIRLPLDIDDSKEVDVQGIRLVHELGSDELIIGAYRLEGAELQCTVMSDVLRLVGRYDLCVLYTQADVNAPSGRATCRRIVPALEVAETSLTMVASNIADVRKTVIRPIGASAGSSGGGGAATLDITGITSEQVMSLKTKLGITDIETDLEGLSNLLAQI